TSPATPSMVLLSTTLAYLRRPLARPLASHKRAVCATGGGPAEPATILRRSVPAGRRTAPAVPSVRTGPTIRETRKQRVARRSRSCPTTYHRPRQDTTPHGSRVRATGDSAGCLRCANVTA